MPRSWFADPSYLILWEWWSDQPERETVCIHGKQEVTSILLNFKQKADMSILAMAQSIWLKMFWFYYQVIIRITKLIA